MKKSAWMMLTLIPGLWISFVKADSSTAHPPATEPSPTIQSAMSARSMMTPTSTPLPLATPMVSPAALLDSEKKKILGEYQKAVSSQRLALQHQEKAAMKELNAAQSMKQKKWREEQKQARKSFFDQHTSGPERREYVQKYLKDKDAFDQSLRVEYSAAKKGWAEKSQAFTQSQKEQEVKFKEALNQGVRPAAELWPKSN